ncbi:16S rRNA (guanine(966)-N(2))-methyltransferase RsmD [Pseudaestuariivita atlantica]|uniref:DNA methyltransferase n=1 Tax=Pseudaestuariivita atlantica TaxID=1317121 RepID=A0A0L1JSI0_9RHOB|nr:16S rRNA (guanine(966)-N(2))-methyltransferase RsmD [Pseudaestuariivita atlantica]KNG94715.1 DNA methyltransferase [Pseudaestuariivita atlantica]
MRIVGGELGGRRLAALGKGDAKAALRPTTDRLREALFNVLEGGRYGDPVTGARVLDLFAGTGALGLEALSRGAAEAVFVESGRVGQGLIRDNIRALGLGGRARLIARDATRPGHSSGLMAGLVFLDPPYGRDLGARALAAAAWGGWLAEDALIVWEEAAPMDPPEGFETLEERRYGGTVFTLMRWGGA